MISGIQTFLQLNWLMPERGGTICKMSIISTYALYLYFYQYRYESGYKCAFACFETICKTILRQAIKSWSWT